MVTYNSLIIMKPKKQPTLFRQRFPLLVYQICLSQAAKKLHRPAYTRWKR